MDSLKPGDVVTLGELIEEEENRRVHAQVLARQVQDKEGRCTYSEGYCEQPVFSCLTCHSVVPVGLCFGCAFTCHIEHQVVEIFGKRHFRCDCGNRKAISETDYICQLEGKKATENKENSYNHNFAGKYCLCRGEYKEDDTMFQCHLCQDWFHDTCLHADTNRVEHARFEEESEYICARCVESPVFDCLACLFPPPPATKNTPSTPDPQDPAVPSPPATAEIPPAVAVVSPAQPPPPAVEEGKTGQRETDEAEGKNAQTLSRPAKRRRVEATELESPSSYHPVAPPSPSTTTSPAPSSSSSSSSNPSLSSSPSAFAGHPPSPIASHQEAVAAVSPTCLQRATTCFDASLPAQWLVEAQKQGISGCFVSPQSTWRSCCSCEKCLDHLRRYSATYLAVPDKRVNLDVLEEPSEEMLQEEKNRYDPNFDPTGIALQRLLQNPRDARAAASQLAKFHQFAQTIKEGLQNLASSGTTLVTEEVMKQMVRDATRDALQGPPE
eukprot:g43223.t1